MNEKKRPHPVKKPRPACMICGSRQGTVREGEVCLCGRCLGAVAGAVLPPAVGAEQNS